MEGNRFPPLNFLLRINLAERCAKITHLKVVVGSEEFIKQYFRFDYRLLNTMAQFLLSHSNRSKDYIRQRLRRQITGNAYETQQ